MGWQQNISLEHINSNTNHKIIFSFGSVHFFWFSVDYRMIFDVFTGYIDESIYVGIIWCWWWSLLLFWVEKLIVCCVVPTWGCVFSGVYPTAYCRTGIKVQCVWVQLYLYLCARAFQLERKERERGVRKEISTKSCSLTCNNLILFTLLVILKGQLLVEVIVRSFFLFRGRSTNWRSLFWLGV